MRTAAEKDAGLDSGPFTVVKQGHFHVECVNVADRRPTLRRWYVQTEEKRPDGMALTGNREAFVIIWNRTDGERVETIHYREGQTGEEATNISLRLPRTLPWREWQIEVWPDKWGIEVMAWTTSWPVRPGWKLKVAARTLLGRMRRS